LTTPKSAQTCADCYFRRNGLCAMNPERICPTFRAATLTLRPAFSPRLEPVPTPITAVAIA